MKRVFIMFLLALFSPAIVIAGNKCTVTLSTSGTLESQLEAAGITDISELTINGPIDAYDIIYLRGSSIKNYLSTDGLSLLDISNVTLVPGTKYYNSLSLKVSEGLMSTYTIYFYINDFDYNNSSSSSNMLGGNAYTDRYYSNCLAGAFINSSIKEVILPKGTTKVGEYMFYGATLSKINLTGIKEIGRNAFSNTNLSEVSLPADLELVELSSFEGTPWLTNNKSEIIEYQDGIGYMGKVAVSLNESATTATFRDGTLGVGGACASLNENLVSVSFPNTLKHIGHSAFEGCTKLTSLTFPDSLKDIGSYAFNWCQALGKISLSKNIEIISCRAFQKCTNMDIDKWSENTTYIGLCAFAYSAITNVDIPKTCTFLPYKSFEKTDSLKTIRYNASSCYTDAPFSWSGNPDLIIGADVQTFPKLTTLSPYYNSVTFESRNQEQLSKGLILEEQSLAGIQSKKVEIGEGVTEIGRYCFRYGNVAELLLPSTLTIVGYNAATDASLIHIKAKTAPSESSSFASGAYVFVPKGTKSQYKSWNNYNIVDEEEDVEEKDGYTYAINGDEATLISVSNIPTNITIGGYIEHNSASIPVTAIARNLFKNNSNIISATITAPVKQIGDYAFNSCNSLKEVNLPESLTKIGYYAFCGCSSLSKISIPTAITIIYGNTFNGCSSLKEVNIPASVESIGWQAFYGCTSITEINISAVTPPSLGSYPFSDTTYSKAILYVPSGSEETYAKADYWRYFNNIKTGIADVVKDNNVNETGRYSIGGFPVDDSYRGVVIIKYSDGSVKKAVVGY